MDGEWVIEWGLNRGELIFMHNLRLQSIRMARWIDCWMSEWMLSPCKRASEQARSKKRELVDNYHKYRFIRFASMSIWFSVVVVVVEWAEWWRRRKKKRRKERRRRRKINILFKLRDTIKIRMRREQLNYINNTTINNNISSLPLFFPLSNYLYLSICLHLSDAGWDPLGQRPLLSSPLQASPGLSWLGKETFC